VGDAFGERFFLTSDEEALAAVAGRRVPPGPWPWTDDTSMAISVLEVLLDEGRCHQDRLAESFARRYEAHRNYGPAMHRMLAAVARGAHWGDLAPALFGGAGSFGNGAAMRVAPLGAWFADDLRRAAEEARRSAVVTHTHPEGVGGAVAVAVAAALAGRSRAEPAPAPSAFLDEVAAWLDHGTEVAEGLRRAARLGPEVPVAEAAAALGNGSAISAQDTVPFALWCAAAHIDDFEEALWHTVSGLGDRDTTCAIVGGVVAARVGLDGIPPSWRRCREPLP
jgi:ADP-ribosylglycohydrolase